jgi:hypothetical protein
MASGSGNGQQRNRAARSPAARVVFTSAYSLEPPPAMTPVQPVVPAPAHLLMPQVLMPPAFRMPAPLSLMSLAPFRFTGHRALSPLPPRAPPPSPVALVSDVIEMVPLEPNYAFWASYRSGGSPPVEMDFMGRHGGPAASADVPDPNPNG